MAFLSILLCHSDCVMPKYISKGNGAHISWVAVADISNLPRWPHHTQLWWLCGAFWPVEGGLDKNRKRWFETQDQFRHYLLGREFLVRTDHSSLRWLCNFKGTTGSTGQVVRGGTAIPFCMTRRETFKCWDLVRPILEVLWQVLWPQLCSRSKARYTCSTTTSEFQCWSRPK